MERLIKQGIDLIKGIWSLGVGLAVTAWYLVNRKITVQYPKQVVPREASESFRGPIELVGQPKDPATPKCISCMMCVSACPSGCISITKQKPPKLSPEEEKAFAEAEARGEKPKRPVAPRNPATWRYNYTYCSLCACCIEACPVNSIKFSNELYLAGTSRGDFHYDLLARLKRKAAEAKAAEDAKASETKDSGSADAAAQPGSPNISQAVPEKADEASSASGQAKSEAAL